MDNISEIIESAVVEKDSKRYMYCAKAYEIFEKHGIPLIEIGKYCNQNKIKIAKCQLGCFGH